MDNKISLSAASLAAFAFTIGALFTLVFYKISTLPIESPTPELSPAQVTALQQEQNCLIVENHRCIIQNKGLPSVEAYCRHLIANYCASVRNGRVRQPNRKPRGPKL